jgi:hypothetical protein
MGTIHRIKSTIKKVNGIAIENKKNDICKKNTPKEPGSGVLPGNYTPKIIKKLIYYLRNKNKI